jgi:gamma-glutamyltranspeptidase/glutathione hydrolase
VATVYEHHAVVSQEANASEAGRAILNKGGNAVDAAVATAMALAVTLPEAGNLGGGGFMVVYLAEGRQVVTFDFRETAPLSSTPRMYLDEAGQPRHGYRTGAWAAGVPGTVRGLALAHRKHGKLPWAELVKPAAVLARAGFAISGELASALNRQLAPRRGGGGAATRDDLGRLADFPESVAAFAKPDRSEWRAGDRLVQTDLADTLDRIKVAGDDDFYSGKTAELLVAYMNSHGGLITAEDLRGYEAKIRPAVHTSFRGTDVYSMGPPSGGGIVLCQTLNMLELFDLKADGPTAPRTVHRVTEAMRRAFFVRATQVGDPDFVSVPVSELVSKPYAAKLARSMSDRATPSAQLADFRIQGVEGDHTTHLSVIDDPGNAVALTYTLEDSYGAKCVVAGAGFILNNEMGDFNVIPGQTDARGRVGTPSNVIAPRKRMLSSQTPTIGIKDGQVAFVSGSPGGRTIPNTTLWVVLNLLEFGLSPQAAVQAARTHHQWFPDVLTLEGLAWPDTTVRALKALGHQIKFSTHQGDANSIVIETGSSGRRIHGVADTRRATAKSAGD